MYKILHYVSKYNFMVLVYAIFLALTLTFINTSYLTFILTSVIYVFLIKRKILVFTSSWIEEDN
ncbi:MAG: hypothetical protein RSD36_09620 [Terrisporobacter sp.]